jgi:hypothetical protein
MQEVHYIALILIWTHQEGHLATMVKYSLHLHLQLVSRDLEMLALHLTSRMSHRFWRVSMFCLALYVTYLSQRNTLFYMPIFVIVDV